MMTRSIRHALACCAALAGGGCNALAQDMPDVEVWRCSAPYGTYHTHELPIGDKRVVTGRIFIHSVDTGPRWASQAKVSLEDSKRDSGECDCAAVVAKGFDQPPAVDFYAAHGEQEDLMGGRKFGVPITFRIAIDPAGPMTVTIGKEHLDTRVFTLAHPLRDTIELSCSGADVSFLNIDAR